MQHLPELLALATLASTASADTETTGCQVNPAGSLTVLAGDGSVGEAVRFGIDNPLGTQSPGSFPALLVSTASIVATPCGPQLPGFGMQSGGAPGELLVELTPPNPLAAIAGPPWLGAGTPSEIDLPIPANPNLVGLELAVQGALLDPTGGSAGVFVGLTEGVRLTITAECGGPTPCVDITSTDRVARGAGYGFDYEFDDGEEDVVRDSSAITDWTGVAIVDHDDWWAFDVADADALHESHVSGRRVACDFVLTASTFANHFIEDGSATADLDVAFEATERMRFYAYAATALTLGYGESRARVDGPNGAVFAVASYQGDSAEEEATGWIDVGSYTVDAHASAFAYGDQQFSETQTASLEFELLLRHAADWDLDGDVDASDASGFHASLAGGATTADFDGDGDTDADDGAAFDAAWAAAQG